MDQNTNNPILKQTEEAIIAKVPQELRNTMNRIVLAGKKVMYSEQTADLMSEQLKQPGDPATVAGQGVAKLFVLLLQQSIPQGKGGVPTLNMEAAMPAMQVLLCDALGFMEEAGMMEVTPDLLATATQEMIAAILQFLGVTPEKLSELAAQRQAGGQPQATGQPEGAAQPAAPAQGGGLLDQAMGG